MELWIRSQDKERLVKVHDVYIEGWLIRANFQGHYSGCNYVDLGEYNSKERALEVFDEIQSILLPNIKLITRNYTDEELEECSIKDLVTPPIEDVKIQELSTYVYEMPEN